MKEGNDAHRGAPLEDLFPSALAQDGLLVPGDKLVVALSGGRDSTALLHLLRFCPGLSSFDLVAAHFDHRMRPESSTDLLWVKGLCRSWGVRLVSGEADSPPSTEEEAREARYGFLFEVKDQEEASWVLTGHHGDDQAETVLFRVLRGTGLRGLAGIPMSRSPGVYRPLLRYSREEVMAYAEAWRIPFRQDSTNQDSTYSRNFLRHEILPLLQDAVAPGARGALRRLARLAKENEDAWESLSPQLLASVLLENDGEVSIVRSALLAYHPAVQNRILREILQRSNILLDEAGTRATMEFTRTGASGQSISLPGGVELVRDFDRFRLEFGEGKSLSIPLVISGPGPGSGSVSLGGARFHVGWGTNEMGGYSEAVEIPLSGVQFPLLMRAWEAGDRIRLPYGTKKLKKLFAEAKIPVVERGRIPILEDAAGRILWVAGLASSSFDQEPTGSQTLFFGIRNVDEY